MTAHLHGGAHLPAREAEVLGKDHPLLDTLGVAGGFPVHPVEPSLGEERETSFIFFRFSMTQGNYCSSMLNTLMLRYLSP